MARVSSTMVALGTKAHSFNLPDTVSGKQMALPDVKGVIGTMIMFICNHCPFVKHVNTELVKLGDDYKEKGIGFVAINSNDIVSHPDDAPDLMAQVALESGYPFPYLYDETQEIAQAYDAACTPDFFIYDKNLQLVYRGQLDDSRPGNGIPVTGKDIRNALERLINNQPVPQEQRPSIGCNIKWKQPA